MGGRGDAVCGLYHVCNINYTCMGSKDSSPSAASPEVLIAPHFAQTAPSNIYWCALELQEWLDGQAGR